MNRRAALALAAVGLLVVTAGCLAWVTGGGEMSNETLDAEPVEAYDFETDRHADIQLRTDNTYLAVYNVTDRSSVRLYQTTRYGTEDPLEFEAFRFQYTNGTVINGSTFRAHGGEVDRTPDETFVRFTEEMENGKLAISGSGTPRRFVLPTYVTGSYAVTLPEGFSVDVPIVGHVAPRGYTVETVEDRDRILWDDVTSSSVVVQSYRERDLWIFTGIMILASVVAIAGLSYFRRQLEDLQKRRQQMGLGVYDDEDVEDDEDGNGPPPGRP